VKDNFSKFVGLSLTIPLLNGMQNRTAMQRAMITTRIAETNYMQQKNQLRYDVYTAYATASGSLKKYKAYQKSVLAQRESFRSAEKRYENGTINSLELTQAKVRLMQSESDLLQAKYTYLFKLKVLELYLGRGIQL
jgi:outer membrane protein